MKTISGCADRPKAELVEKECPKCGAIIEYMTGDAVAFCPECGEPVLDETMKCMFWCDHAKECVGEKACAAAEKLANRIEFDPVKFERFTKW